MEDKDLDFLKEMGFDPKTLTISPETIFQMHMINIAVAVIMIAIGAFLVHKSKKQKSSGKKTAGWILIGLGTVITLTHCIQMLL